MVFAECRNQSPLENLPLCVPFFCRLREVGKFASPCQRIIALSRLHGLVDRGGGSSHCCARHGALSAAWRDSHWLEMAAASGYAETVLQQKFQNRSGLRVG